ncbi:hypothetical protein [Parapedobacter sp. 10938]|uniref:hypothetical protein n=1 Tax=Parapedobacter flavus TaxID=3110225 RepID=UPI002DBC0D9D|nr:hypothetical protein [Parapedobacter sp. 10938]MEC3882085.1 hypothetical protein [Parapedobacter sp. 10938]
MVRVILAFLIGGAYWALCACSSEKPRFDDGEVIATDSIPVIEISTDENLGPFDIDTLIDLHTLEIVPLETDDQAKVWLQHGGERTTVHNHPQSFLHLP